MKPKEMAVATAAQVAMLRPDPAQVTPMQMLQVAMERGVEGTSVV